MLRKLLKFELKATSRTMLPMLGLLLATAAGGNLAVNNLFETNNAVFSVLGVILLAAFGIAMLAAGIVAFVLMIRRFYKNLLRDEGYLMMTLPASVYQHIAAKLLIAVMWFAVTGVVMVAALVVLVFKIEMAQNALNSMAEIVRGGYLIWGDVPLQDKAFLLSLLFYLPVILLLACAGLCIDCYASMAVGHSFPGHKGLLSFAAYFGMMIFWNLLGSLAGSLLDTTGMGSEIGGLLMQLSDRVEVHVVMIGAIAVLLIGNAISYAITAYFLKNRLNLD